MPKTSEARRAYALKYYYSHRDELRVQQNAYSAAHRDEKRAYDVAYRQSHGEEIAAYLSAYYQRHKVEARALGAARYRENRAAIAARSAKEFAEFTEWLQILRTNNGCEDCGTHEGMLHHHHVDPETKLYNISCMYSCSLDTLEDELEKCVVLCCSCHQLRHVALKPNPRSV